MVRSSVHSGGCWCRRLGDKFQFLGWLVQFAHPFGDDRWSKGRHHSGVIVQVPEQMQR